MSMTWLDNPVKTISQAMRATAQAHQMQLTKPPGSLGRLEELAIRLAAMQDMNKPLADNIHIAIFAADHGIADENVSAFPQAVTTEMVRNFARGGAAISVLAKQLDAVLEVVDLGTVHEPELLPGVIPLRIAAGTASFIKQAAMTEEQLEQALQAGLDSVMRAKQNQAHIYIGGEMGIANTTTAAAVAAALLNKQGADLVGPGTGVDTKGVKHKADIVDRALALHKADMQSPLDILRCVGGFEIVALCGAYIAAAQQGMAVLVDGFISSVAALAAVKIQPEVNEWFFYSHQSAEPGHQHVLQALEAQPLLNLNMRLGEGSGAAVAVSLLRQACACHNEMSTFAEAGVSTGE
ncbi:MAG: nicotinate-nucleotide--dimethylbenzimidazole phosphoribosyltransferase [Gammaproteobacteria bacterium]|nr:nicotinate-nucleotide--dimethylbenzimidazole phosphoribosyltransferase [Gammaproteobacteria bacterium]